MKSELIFIKTTRDDNELRERLSWFLQQPGLMWKEGTSPLRETLQLTISRKGVILEANDFSLSFHPSMALLRLINIIKGESDRFLQALELRKGDILIDATMGLCTDALISAWAVGSEGKIIAIESSPILAALVKDGLIHFNKEKIPNTTNKDKLRAWAELTHASQQIEIIWGNHLEILKKTPSSSVDVVYFDPMFRHTREQSSSIKPLHKLSNLKALQEEAVFEGCRVAKKRVVLKERKNSKEFSRLGFKIVPFGKYSKIDYGVILL